MSGTLSISRSGVSLSVWSVMTPLKSQLSLGTHFMAEGQVTNGFVSADSNDPDDCGGFKIKFNLLPSRILNT